MIITGSVLRAQASVLKQKVQWNNKWIVDSAAAACYILRLHAFALQHFWLQPFTSLSRMNPLQSILWQNSVEQAVHDYSSYYAIECACRASTAHRTTMLATKSVEALKSVLGTCKHICRSVHLQHQNTSVHVTQETCMPNTSGECKCCAACLATWLLLWFELCGDSMLVCSAQCHFARKLEVNAQAKLIWAPCACCQNHHTSICQGKTPFCGKWSRKVMGNSS